jgi:iron complex transport system permease protein
MAPSFDPPGHRRRAVLLLGLLAAGLVLACVVAVGAGAFPISPAEILTSVADRAGIAVATPLDATADAVLWDIRLPRVALAVVVGASLACAGALMQGSLGNPLAEPGIVGVSSGAALGAVAAIVAGVSVLGLWTVGAAAFVAGLATVGLVVLAARSEGRTEVVTLILVGIAVNAAVGAVIGLLMYLSDDAELRNVSFWTMGSVAHATWPRVAVVAPLAAVGIVAGCAQARRLDLLSLGEGPARHLGVDVERVRRRTLAVVALLTAAAVAVSGIVLFVGLVVPHLVRTVSGPRHRLLLPASVLAGAVVLVVADLVARTAVAPAELPLGTLTALVGSPVFFWQLLRTRRRQGGWA